METPENLRARAVAMLAIGEYWQLRGYDDRALRAATRAQELEAEAMARQRDAETPTCPRPPWVRDE